MIKEISVTKYGNDKQLIPTFSPHEIYQYSHAMLKHLPKDSLKNFKKLLYDNTPVYYKKITIDRKTHNSNITNDITDVTLIKLGFLRVVFPWEGGQFDSPFIFQEELI